MRAVLLSLLPLLASASPLGSFNALWYDQGLYGAYPWQDFVSFDLAAPRVNFLQQSEQCDQSYTFIEPRGRSVETPGPMILDAQGDLVYLENKFGEAMDVRVQTFQDQDYLTFWTGTDDGTHGRGHYYMLNSSYEVAYKIDPTNGLEGDLHEFHITDQGTALMTIYQIIPADLTSVGGPAAGWIYDGLFQELDIATGELVFEWRASNHYQVADSLADPQGKGNSESNAWDFFHINSIDKDPDGNYYVSARYTHTVTCISPNGTVLWELGGRHSSFEDLSNGAASNFSWQHHVSYHDKNRLTIFDNGAYDTKHHTADYSRGLLVQLDLEKMTATLVQDYVSPGHILAHSQGSVQILDNGNVFVGWGHTAAFTEFKPNGEVLCDAHFGASAFFGWGWVKSYRAFKGNWVGRPSTNPSITRSKRKVYVSWNGATEVASWTLQGSASADDDSQDFADVETVPKESFEAMFHLNSGVQQYLRVVAKDAAGQVLGTSEVLDRKSGQVVSGAFEPFLDSDIVPLQLLLVVLGLITMGGIIWTFFKPARRLSSRGHYIHI
ncbi:hypothetical protein K490DRAFT_63191 [Saccharata proteae CBS 121410]|uniref:Arylsulfotransferase n=1 Tax=Saccharata proteae CBS 121410 TaxID=1314787 RepID=A0A9P4HYS5_9PEZI|nr:hypothetical protein K490DRAFT_63191 [Saccharata proteae CBS 121410]